MLFRSTLVEAQWDTWCYYHGGTYYLYYLITETSPGEGFGLATSSDGVSWQDHGWALRASDEMVHFLGTGSVWIDPLNADRFLCNYSEWRLDEQGKKRQNILFAWSTDLISWHKFGDEYMFRINEQYYEPYGRWDCIFAIPREGGGYWGTWTATPQGRENLDGGIGIGISEDGLAWQALPPPSIEPDAQESGAFTIVDGTVHAMFGISGMQAYVADRPDGVYRVSERNPLLLSRSHSYFSRLFVGPDGLLVNHHVMDGQTIESGRPITYAAPLKRFSLDETSTQRWLWWEGNEVLKSRETEFTEPLDPQSGFVAEAKKDLSGPRSSIFTLHIDGQEYAIVSGVEGIVTFSAKAAPKDWQRMHTAKRAFGNSAESHCRILVRRGMLELYINDHFIECWAMGCPDAAEARITAADNEGAQAWHMDV